MADNVTVDNNSLTDYIVSTDEAASGQVQRVKLSYSANGSDTHVTADADGLLVNLGANNDVTITSGTVTVTDGGATISVDDGGSSLTVDGTVAVSGTVTVDSELPAAVTLADNASNPTAPAVGAFSMVWDGATWDRLPGTSVDGALVNLGANNDVTVTGTVTANLAAGTNNIGDVDVLTMPGTFTEDAAAAGGETGHLMLGVRRDADTSPVSADNDYQHPVFDARGAMKVEAFSGEALPVTDNGSTLSVDDGAGSLTVDNAALSVTGGGVEASALRVTIATDSTGVLSVDDNGGSLTVDGTVTANAGTGTFTTGGVAAHDAAVSGNPVLEAGRASDATPTAVSADGDVVYAWHDRRGAYKTAIVDDAGDSVMDGTNNAVRVNIVAGAGSGGTASTDDAAFTAASGSGTPMMGFATSDVVDSGDVGVVRMTTTRDLMVTLRDSAGDSAMDDANNALRVNVVAGSSGGPSKTDDAAFTIATDSVAPMGALVDETTPDSADEGDVGIPRMTADRKLLVRVVGATDGNRLDIDASGRPTVNVNGTVTVDSELPAAATLADNTTNPSTTSVGSFPHWYDGTTWDRALGNSTDGLLVNLGANNDVIQATASNLNAQVVGAVAQDAAAAGNPVISGLRASDAEPTAMSADGDVVYAWGDRSGRFVTTQKCASTAPSSVAGSATSVSLLASNAARLGAVINNDSTAILYVKLGATASTTSYTYKLFQDGVCEIPYGYTGAVDGVWSSATGNARITEMS